LVSAFLRFLAIGERRLIGGTEAAKVFRFWGKVSQKSRILGIFLAFCASKRLPDWQRLLE
jgi:hypothetical protein